VQVLKEMNQGSKEKRIVSKKPDSETTTLEGLKGDREKGMSTFTVHAQVST